MNLFNTVRFKKPKRNKFNLSHEKKLTASMGDLVPILIQEILPGDSFRVNTEILMRMQPLLAPIYARLNIKVDYFFVPNRLLWGKWEKFITGGEKANEIQPAFPYYMVSESNRTVANKGTLSDYLGIPTPPTGVITQPLKVSALPHRAYATIWNEYYRDQNLQDPIDVEQFFNSEGDCTGELNAYTQWLQKRSWEKDYFTSATPYPQKGGDVLIPNQTRPGEPSTVSTASGTPIVGGADFTTTTGGVLQVDAVDAQINNITDISIEDLRRSARLQEWLEKNMRAGSRYVESLLAHWGVHNDDLRLQRPQYLGGFTNPVVISEVLSNFQFSGDADGQPQGHMAGHGIGVGSGAGFSHSFKEHGYVLGLMTILPRTEYQQGIHRHFTRFDKLEFAWPSFAQIGEQPVRNKEIYFDWLGSGTGELTFGYQSRYAEYKSQPSTVHGDFKDSLSHWTATRIFANAPALNEAFIEADPTNRFFAVQDGTQELLINLHNNISALRELPQYNTPTL